MKNGGFPLVKIGGVNIIIDYAWLIMFFIITIIAENSIAQAYPDFTATVHWMIGIIVSFLIFFSVLIHELAHLFMAKKLGVRIKTIRLHVFGALTSVTPETRSGRHEFIIALAGWAASMALGFLCLTGYAYFWFVQYAHPVRDIAAYLMFANFILAALHMIPGFPLDGGSILRAILWDRWNDAERATRIVSQIGNGLALFLIIFGVLQFIVTRNLFSGLLFVVGLFMKQSSAGIYRSAVEQNALSKVRVSEAMSTNVITVDWLVSVEELVREYICRYRHTFFPVTNRDETIGMVSLEGVRSTAKDLWTFKQVRDIMVPIENVVCTGPDSNAGDVLKQMDSAKTGRMPVMENGRLVGVVTRNDIAKLFRIRSDLGIS